MAPVYLHSKIRLKYGQLDAFNEAMAKAKPIVEEHGWKLVGAWSTMIGDLNEVHDIWEIEDANAVGSVMRSAFADPAFRAVAARFAEQIEEEILAVLTKTPYSPRARAFVPEPLLLHGLPQIRDVLDLDVLLDPLEAVLRPEAGLLEAAERGRRGQGCAG